eukprot:scaffold84577_cov59-Phaeocystis_antarctica.AAC.1
MPCVTALTVSRLPGGQPGGGGGGGCRSGRPRVKHDMFSFHICDSGGSAACSTLSASESHSSYMPLTAFAIRARQVKVATGPAAARVAFPASEQEWLCWGSSAVASASSQLQKSRRTCKGGGGENHQPRLPKLYTSLSGE